MKKQEHRVVLDTNVWVSALIWGGKPAAIISGVEQGKVCVFISEDVVAEISQVLAYPKIEKIYRPIGLRREDLIAQVLRLAKFIAVVSKVEVIDEHPADNEFLECALAAKADCIVSGDKHILNVVAYKKIKMLTVSEFLELVPKMGF